jgi:hypothetical protein
VSDSRQPTGGGKPLLTLKPKGGKQVAPRAQEKPSKPPAPNPPPRPKGPAYTPPKAHEPLLERFWLVMRSNGQRPKVRHLPLQQAQDEAQRVAANNPSTDVWVIRCETVETVSVDATVAADMPQPASPTGVEPSVVWR